MISNDAVKETRLSKSSSTSATGTGRIRMSFSKTVVLFLLLSGFWSQMVSSAPTPQQKDAVAAAGQDNEGSLLGAESSMNTGIDYDDATTELRYGGMREKGEPAEPPDIRARNPQSSPEIHIIDNVELVSSLFQDHAQHDTSNSTTSTNTSPSPSSKRIDLQRSVEQEEQPDWVFNIVIQKEKAQKSAFIAPDVNWLRDLVPKVVDVVDKPETLIKETIFNAMGKDDVVQVDQIGDRQIFINVVKSQVDSEAEVPQILARLRNLMQTGGPEIDAIFQRQNSEDQQSKNRAVVINVVIVNVLNVNVVNVILPESKAGTDLEARTPESDVEEDSYIVALRESQKDRNKFSVPAAVDHHHHHEEKHHVVPVVGGSTTQQQFNGHYLTEVPTYGHNSTDRPLMAMEKDYLRSSNIQPAQQQLVDKQPTVDKEKDAKPKLPIDPNASLEFVNLPTGPYFTNYADKPSKTASAVVENSGNNNNKVVATNPLPNKKPNKVKDTEKVNSMTSKAANVVRNQIRTIGFIGIPILAGLASTVNAWLPAVAALGRRRKKRSAMEYEEEYDWQPNPKVVGIDDRRRAIEDAQILALLMGKRYMNVSKETLQDSIDNWKNRDQEASAAVPLHTTDVNKLASTNKPLWFQFQRPGSPQTTETTTSTTTTAPSTVKKPNYYEDENYETNKYYSNNNKPLFYSAASVTDDAMEHRELVDYDDVGNVGPSFSSTSSTFTESGEYVMGDVKETQSEENVASSYPESVTPHIHILPATSPSGNDFDIVANFVQAMMMNSNNKNNGNPNYDGPENREDVDGPEHREEIYLVKSPSIVNSTIPGGANRIPSTGSTVSLFAADPIMPSWGANSENVTNSPVTYVSLRVPPVPSSPAKFPVKATTSTQPSSSDYYDDTDLIDGSDQPSSENVGLQFHEDETGITFFVSKDVPTRITTPLSSNAGTQEIKPTSTGRPSSQWFSDPFENGLFVGSSTANTFRPVSPTSIVSTSNTPIPTEPETRPISLPATHPTSFKPNFQSGTRPPLSNFQSVTRPGSPPPNTQPQFGNRPTSSSFDLQSNFQAGSRPPTSVTPSFQTNRPSGSESTPTKFQSNRPSSLLTMASFTASNRPRPTVPPPIDVSSDVGSTYTKGQITVTNAPLQDFSTLTGDSSLVSANVDKNNVLSSIIKGAGSSPLPFKDQSTSRPTTSTGSSSDINNLFGMYSSTATASTNRPIMTTTSSEEGIEPTLDNLMTQLETNRTGLVSTKRPVGGLHFINTSTDVVIISPYDVTPRPLYSSAQMESVEAEEEEDFTEPSDTITVDAAEGNQPDSVPAVSNLANLLFASSVPSSSGSSVSFSDSSSSGGVTSSASAVSVDPFALLYTFGLASAGILAMTLPIWVPLVVAKRKRRTGGYGLSKKKDKKKKKIKNQYPANKKKKKTYSQNKASYGEPPPNHYKDLDEDVNYNGEDYNPAGPGNHHQYQSTTIDDLYRGNGGSHGDYSDSDIIDNYSTLYRDLFTANSDDVLSDAGPLSSEDVYGPASPSYYDDRRAARRRRSNRNKKQFKRFH